MTKEEALAMDLALEALRFGLHVGFDESSESQIKKGAKAFEQHNKALNAIKQARSAPVQEPVAVARVDDLERGGRVRALAMGLALDAALYTTPPAQPAPVQEPDHGDELTIAYMSGLHDGKNKRKWVGLTEDEIDEIFNNWPTYNLDHYEFAQVVEAKVFEKNSATAVVMPDVLNPKDENPAYAAGWNDCRAEMLKGRTE